MTRYGMTIRTGRSERARHRDPLTGVQGHHGFPQYLGGVYGQTLLNLPNDLHYLYHQELDRIVGLPRRSGRTYYRRLTGPQMLSVLKRVVKHAGDFDRRYRTRILTALRAGIRQSRPLAGRRWPRTLPPPQQEWEVSNESLIRYGSRGSAVQELQYRLNQWLRRTSRPILAVDGIFGSRVESAVRAFQSMAGLAVDGIVGPHTLNALRVFATAPDQQPSTPAHPAVATDRWVLPDSVRASGEQQFVRYDNPPPWNNGNNCTRSFTAGARELGDHIRATFRGVSSIGGYKCRQNTANPAQTSVHGTGRAIDIMISPINGRANSTVGDPIANWLIQNAGRIGIQYIIWNHVQWNGSRTGRKDRDYHGPNPHIDHIHVELNRDGAARITPWFLNRT